MLYFRGMRNTATTTRIKEGTKVITDDFSKYTRTHTKSESYLYNNRMFSSNLISKEQYNLNYHWIQYL